MPAKPMTHACNPRGNTPLARLNDAFRQSPCQGSLIVTAGVIALGGDAVVGILALVRDFADFTRDNDPYGEHDFAVFRWDGERLFWKIDYYDRSMQFASPDPLDPAKTRRVLTVMLASEY